jgi:hypothetical protein
MQRIPGGTSFADALGGGPPAEMAVQISGDEVPASGGPRAAVFPLVKVKEDHSLDENELCAYPL